MYLLLTKLKQKEMIKPLSKKEKKEIQDI